MYLLCKFVITKSMEYLLPLSVPMNAHCCTNSYSLLVLHVTNVDRMHTYSIL